MQTQEITESPFHRKLISAEKVQGCLKECEQHNSVYFQAHFLKKKKKKALQTGVLKPLAINCEFGIFRTSYQ